jgi:surface carbohydrate biosynthesis protein
MYISADSCTTGSQTKYDEYFKEVYRIVKSLPEKKLVVKPHPGPLLTKYVENLVNEIDPSITVIRNTDLHELINECEVLITFNNSTTALEAISLNKPVISLQTESWANEDDIAQAGAVVSISNIKDCEKEIKKILFDTLFRKQQMDKGSNFLRKYMSNPGKASKSVAEIFKNFTETSK